MSDVKKAFRGLSMCSHPDRLRGRLKREASPAETRRGEIIFTRASAAKDELTKMFKSRKGATSVQCYEGELEMALVQAFTHLGGALSALGISDYVELATGLAWKFVTFELGVMNTLLNVLWMTFLFRLLRQLFTYLWRMGILRFALGLLTTVVIAPWPTVINFFSLPVIRLVTFLKEMAGANKPAATEDATHPPQPEPQAEGADEVQSVPADTPMTLTGATAARSTMASRQAREDTPQRNLRQRKKKEGDEEREKRNQDLLTGSPAAVAGKPLNHGAGPMPDGVFSVVQWGHKEPLKARQEAADAVQFDLLLILTKPVIPLFMLISVGQVLNGFISSIFIGHALRKWVPKMTYEAHHLFCCFFGVLHTFLGVSAQQVEDFSNRDDKQILHLAWSWSFKDVMSVMHMCLLGATVTATAGLGNEPSFATSFAAGIALRIAMAQDTVRGLRATTLAASWVEARLRDLGVKLESAEEVVTYSGGGIGDCGGGPFRMLFGDDAAGYVAFALKAWLMAMPLLATLQWAHRAYRAHCMYREKRKFWKLWRCGQRCLLCAFGALQCCMLGGTVLNATNGALANFWVAMLVGAVGESMMSTFDIRGPMRQVLFIVLFVVV